MRAFRFASYFCVALVAVCAFSAWRAGEVTARPDSHDLVAVGRQVYISEGCIHCHSQYVRPVGLDRELWGAPTLVDQALGQAPVLIGNRRQGPDLANVALRRDEGWNRIHLIQPAVLTPGSRMPSYRYLFMDGDYRGAALLAYLNSLQPSLLNADKQVAVPKLDNRK
jgi:cytochrome c oxidase cbb3-type subunit 2